MRACGRAPNSQHTEWPIFFPWTFLLNQLFNYDNYFLFRSIPRMQLASKIEFYCTPVKLVTWESLSRRSFINYACTDTLSFINDGISIEVTINSLTVKLLKKRLIREDFRGVFKIKNLKHYNRNSRRKIDSYTFIPYGIFRYKNLNIEIR